MKIFKGVLVAILFALVTLFVGFLIFNGISYSNVSLQKTVVIMTLFVMIGMARMGYGVGTGHINKINIPDFLKKIDLKKLLFKTKK
ncbi:MAG: hypothetical protein EVA56_03710 [alpha proteobacterium HIMB114]|nr:MAG: hypothetical protein EVA56_03710 [alpha proteobacterium HIMB114]|tara:strand:- start:222 stop:479 length:258 start_codon:yes stop_codon:yes gene_type:complete